MELGEMRMLRHGFASKCSKYKTDLHTIQHLLGHRKIANTVRNFHLAHGRIIKFQPPYDNSKSHGGGWDLKHCWPNMVSLLLILLLPPLPLSDKLTCYYGSDALEAPLESCDFNFQLCIIPFTPASSKQLFPI